MTSDKDKPKIRILKDGPYIVSGGVPLIKQGIGTDDEGNSYQWIMEVTYPLKDTYSLCRCGESKNKPFCDGSNWISKEKMDEWRVKWDKKED